MVSYLSNGKKLFKKEIDGKLYFVKAYQPPEKHEDKNNIIYNPLEMEALGFEIAKALKIQTPNYFIGELDGEMALYIEHFNQFTESFAVVPYGRIDRKNKFTFQNIKKNIDENFESDTYERILEGALFDILIGNSKREKNSILFLCNADGKLRHSGWVTNEVGFSEYRDREEFKNHILEIEPDLKGLENYINLIKNESEKVYDSFMQRVNSTQFLSKLDKTIYSLPISSKTKALAKSFLDQRIIELNRFTTKSYPDNLQRLFDINYQRKTIITSPIKLPEPVNGILHIEISNFNKLGPLWDNGNKFNAQFPFEYYQFKKRPINEIKQLIVGDIVGKAMGMNISPSYAAYYKEDYWYASRDHYEGKNTYIAYRSSFVTADDLNDFYSYRKKIDKITEEDSSSVLTQAAALDYIIGNTRRNAKNIFIKRDYNGKDRVSEIKSNYAELKNIPYFKEVAASRSVKLPELSMVLKDLKTHGLFSSEEVDKYYSFISKKTRELSSFMDNKIADFKKDFTNLELKSDYISAKKDSQHVMIKENKYGNFNADECFRLLGVPVQDSYLYKDKYIVTHDTRHGDQYTNVDPLPFYIDAFKGVSRFNCPFKIAKIVSKEDIKNKEVLLETFVIDYLLNNKSRDFSKIVVFQTSQGLDFLYSINNFKNTPGEEVTLEQITKAKEVLHYKGDIFKKIKDNKKKLINLNVDKERLENLL